MNLGESVAVAAGKAHGFEWKAEIRQYKNGPHPNVVVHTEEGDWVRLHEMGEHLEAEDMAMMADDIACALTKALANAVSMMRAKSRWHYEQARKLGQVEHSAAALALEEMADRIERGEA